MTLGQLALNYWIFLIKLGFEAQEAAEIAHEQLREWKIRFFEENRVDENEKSENA